MTIFEHTDYRSYLKAVYVEKTKRSPRFSLRAFARHIQLSPAAVTRILKGEKNLSLERAITIGQKLNLSAEENSYFSLLVQLAQTKSPVVRESVLERIRSARPRGDVHDLSVDYFKFISDWYHFAILELVDHADFVFEPKAVANFLGIHLSEVELAIDRLKRLELIELDKMGKPKRLQNRLVVSSKVQSEAIRNYYRQLFNKASDSLESQSPAERVSAAETLLFDASQIEEARKLADEYIEKLIALARKSTNRNDVYQVSLHFFRLNPVAAGTGKREREKSGTESVAPKGVDHE